MKESKANKKAMDYVMARATGAVTYKIADRFTAGIPDTVFVWQVPTSWLEFKMLETNESIHDQLKPVQLVELLKLERTSHRAWVVAFRKANAHRLVLPQTVIYRPSALLHGAVPLAQVSQVGNVLPRRGAFGGSSLGISHLKLRVGR